MFYFKAKVIKIKKIPPLIKKRARVKFTTLITKVGVEHKNLSLGVGTWVKMI